MKSYSVSIQMKATKQYFPVHVILFLMLYMSHAQYRVAPAIYVVNNVCNSVCNRLFIGQLLARSQGNPCSQSLDGYSAIILTVLTVESKHEVNKCL